MTMLVVDDLFSGYGKSQVLHGVSLSVDEGEIVALIGGIGGVQGLLVRAGTGRGAAPGALADDAHIATAPLEFHRRAQPRRTAAHHHGAGPMHRNDMPGQRQLVVETRLGRQTRHIDVGQRIEDVLRDCLGHFCPA